MKEYLTMSEAAILLGKTTKTVKNYIKRGIVKNYFLVDGKYGQEYRISVRDLEPLGFTCLEVLQDNFIPGRRAGEPAADSGEYSPGMAGESPASFPRSPATAGDTSAFVERYEQLVVSLDRSRARADSLAEENRLLKQDLQEKEMLIQVLMHRQKGS